MNWRYASASVVGTSHLNTGTPCQDVSLVTVINSRILLLVASDGAGSAAQSEVGARLTCDTLHELTANHAAEARSVADLDERLTDHWLDTIANRIRQQAAAAELPIREFACTVVAAVLDDSGSAYLQIGDGCIVVGSNNNYAPVTWPSGGDYVNTTHFLTDDSFVENLQIQLNRPPVDEIALFTDGLQMLALQFSTKSAHTPFFRPMFERLRAEQPGESTVVTNLLNEYLGSAVINRRTDDDKSMVLATRASPISEVSETGDEAATTTENPSTH
jgi:hypothetical protein